MKIGYNVTGSERKALVGVISEILDSDAVYKGAPGFGYEIGGCTVDKIGTLVFADDIADEFSASLIEALRERGYTGETDDSDFGVSSQLESDIPMKSLTGNSDGRRLVVEVPREGFSDDAIENLKKVISSKEALIKKAIHADSLPVEITDDVLRFPWFTLSGETGEADAYNRFIHAICEMAKTQKRVTARAQDVLNEKFAMRIFLVRLNLKGPENQVVRRLMLKNLTGNSSWKNGPPLTKIAADENSENIESAGSTGSTE